MPGRAAACEVAARTAGGGRRARSGRRVGAGHGEGPRVVGETVPLMASRMDDFDTGTARAVSGCYDLGVTPARCGPRRDRSCGMAFAERVPSRIAACESSRSWATLRSEVVRSRFWAWRRAPTQRMSSADIVGRAGQARAGKEMQRSFAQR